MGDKLIEVIHKLTDIAGRLDNDADAELKNRCMKIVEELHVLDKKNEKEEVEEKEESKNTESTTVDKATIVTTTSKEAICNTSPPTNRDFTFTDYKGGNIVFNITDYGFDINFKRTVDQGNKSGNYSNRCFLLSFAKAIDIDICKFYEELLGLFRKKEHYNDDVPKIIKKNGYNESSIKYDELLDKLNKDNQSPSRVDDITTIEDDITYQELRKTILTSSEYIDFWQFIRYVKIPKLFYKGLIVIPHINYELDVRTKIDDPNKFGAYFGEINIGTPIIFNNNNIHFTLGFVENDEQLQFIKKLLLEYDNRDDPKITEKTFYITKFGGQDDDSYYPIEYNEE